ncbi:MAG TPA: hypothetical protein VF587_05155 [Solirubrobacteraceae bacterium]
MLLERDGLHVRRIGGHGDLGRAPRRGHRAEGRLGLVDRDLVLGVRERVAKPREQSVPCAWAREGVEVTLDRLEMREHEIAVKDVRDQAAVLR